MWNKLLFKTGIAYLILCLLAYSYYWIGVKWLGFDISTGEKIQILSISLWGWTAAMCTPIAAFFALDAWREQQKIVSESNLAYEILNELYVLQNKVNQLSFLMENAKRLLTHSNYDKDELENIKDLVKINLDEMYKNNVVKLRLKSVLFSTLTMRSHIENHVERNVRRLNTSYSVFMEIKFDADPMSRVNWLSTEWMKSAEAITENTFNILKPYLAYKQK